MMFKLRIVLFCSLIISTGAPAEAEEYPGPDLALRNVLIKYLETSDVSTEARDEVSGRLIGYWRQVEEELPAMTEDDESRIIADVQALKGQYRSHILSPGFNMAVLRKFVRQCAGQARLLNDQISKPDEALAWLRMMGCYADNPGLFFRFYQARLARGNPIDIMRHIPLLSHYVSGPLVDYFHQEARERSSR